MAKTQEARKKYMFMNIRSESQRVNTRRFQSNSTTDQHPNS